MSDTTTSDAMSAGEASVDRSNADQTNVDQASVDQASVGQANGGQSAGLNPLNQTHPRGLHRLLWLLVCLVWPLIWVGGLVTTYDAGMSVPDWPGTYGYNLFLYPYKTWLLGPFDLFIEHGHRLLGAVVGLVAIAVVVAAVRTEHRRSVRWLCVALLAMVIAQGLLGGFRVVLSDRTLAMVHGCFGPAFFAVCTSTLVMTSRWWTNLPVAKDHPTPGRWLRWSLPLMVLLAYAQLILGAMMRHASPTATASSFAGLVGLHVAGAFSFLALSAIVAVLMTRFKSAGLPRPAVFLFGAVFLQVVLGIGTWVVNYGYPSMLAFVPGSETFLIRAKGFLDSIIVTAHVATGSMVLAAATFLATRGYRVQRSAFTTVQRRSSASNGELLRSPGMTGGQLSVATMADQRASNEAETLLGPV